MNSREATPPEVIMANMLFIAFWLSVVLLLLILGQRWPRMRPFRERMLAQWPEALTITSLFLVGMGLAGRSLVNPYAVAILCQALIGLVVARTIPGFDPLPVAYALRQRKAVWSTFLWFLVISIAVGVVSLIVGSFGIGIAQSLFHETNRTQEAAEAFAINKAQAFFVFLAGAGIAEETTYRLVALSFIWLLTGRRWFAIVVSALLFAAYHLTPLDGMYLTFWRFPASQFLGTAIIGLLLGYVFSKRGYETVVLGHTLSNWIGVLFFA